MNWGVAFAMMHHIAFPHGSGCSYWKSAAYYGQAGYSSGAT
jgi:hypothetical protein